MKNAWQYKGRQIPFLFERNGDFQLFLDIDTTISGGLIRIKSPRYLSTVQQSLCPYQRMYWSQNQTHASQ